MNKKLNSIERRLNNLLEATKGREPSKNSWDRGYDAGYITALGQILDIIEEYK